jgi:hypothetical protein
MLIKFGKICLLLFGYIVVFNTGLAAPPPDSNSSLTPWFKTLRTPLTDLSCCGIADCRHYAVRIWRNHYEIFYDGAWLTVADNTVLVNQDNPTGDFIACVDPGFLDKDLLPGPKVICFIRRADT